MSVIHKFKGEWGKNFVWEDARTRAYSQHACGATETWLIGKAEKAENFAMRYYELEPEGYSRDEDHPYDHGVMFLRGAGEVSLDGEVHQVETGDVVYIASDARHQIRNTGAEILGWVCIIPARRRKQGKTVWAEEGLDLTKT